MLARFVNAAPGTTTLPIRHAIDRQPAAGVPARRSRAARRPLISIGSENTPAPGRDVRVAPRADWAFADCRTAPFPGTPDPSQLCVKGGFDPARLYQLAYTVQGSAGARHRPGRHARHHVVLPQRRRRRAGHAESGRRRDPPRGRDRRLAVGQLHPDVHPSRLQRRRRRPAGVGRRLPADRGAADADQRALRRARRRGVAVRGGQRAGDLVGRLRGSGARRRRASLLDRCTASHTCPKIVEAFGSSEFWGLRMSPDLVGTDARTDIPLPANVRRYYYPGTTHGGGRGGFTLDAPPRRPAARCRPTRTPRPTRRGH